MSTRPASRFWRLQRLATAGVVLCGFGALRLGGELDGLWALLALGAVAAELWPDRPRLPARGWLSLQVGFLGYLGVAWAFFGTPVLAVFAQLLVFVQVHRVLTRRGARDDLYAFFIAFGQVLLASVLTFDVLWFLLFVGFLVLFTWAMLLTRLARVTEQSWQARMPDRPVPDSAWQGLDALVRAPLLSGVAGLNLILLAATLGLFFILPRMQVSFLTGSLLPPVHVSGFSDRVRLGEVGMLQLSSEPVMRVQTFGAGGEPVPAAQLYWHGLALDRFDGRGWLVSDDRRIPLSATGRKREGPPSRPWILRQEITLEPLDSRVLFHVPRAAGIYGEFRSMEAVETEGFYLTTPRRREAYTVYSDPRQPSPDQLRGQDPRTAPEALRDRYTQLPSTLSPRVAELAQQWTEGTSSAVDAALAVQSRLRTEFDYSLDQPASAYPDPLEAFLVEVQEGHCEYFATAMALMLRTQGLPTRIVNGFAGAEYNPAGEYWVVRQRDAHSWVELWFPDSGWVIFDPTPASDGGLQASARMGLFARARAWGDYGRVLWSRVMLDYDMGSQAGGVRAILRGLRAFEGDGPGFLSDLNAAEAEQAPDRRGLLGGVAAVLVLAVLLALALRPRRHPSVPPALRKARRALDRFEKRLRKAAGDRGPATVQTAQAWAAWAREQDPALFADAEELVAGYYAARFGGGAVTPGLEAGLSDLARRARGLGSTRRSPAR